MRDFRDSFGICKQSFISALSVCMTVPLNFYLHTSLLCLKRFYEGLNPFVHNVVNGQTYFKNLAV